MTTLASIVTTRLAVIQTSTATTGSSNSFFTFLQVGFGCLVVFLALFWLSLVIWTVRDIRARTQDRVPRILAPVVVAIFFIGGWLVYLVLRPRHRQADLYPQELAETALIAVNTGVSGHGRPPPSLRVIITHIFLGSLVERNYRAELVHKRYHAKCLVTSVHRNAPKDMGNDDSAARTAMLFASERRACEPGRRDSR